jgi:hypothetical protein
MKENYNLFIKSINNIISKNFNLNNDKFNNNNNELSNLSNDKDELLKISSKLEDIIESKKAESKSLGIIKKENDLLKDLISQKDSKLLELEKIIKGFGIINNNNNLNNDNLGVKIGNIGDIGIVSGNVKHYKQKSEPTKDSERTNYKYNEYNDDNSYSDSYSYSDSNSNSNSYSDSNEEIDNKKYNNHIRKKLIRKVSISIIYNNYCFLLILTNKNFFSCLIF